MKIKFKNLIINELLKKGAVSSEASTYVKLVEEYESLSVSKKSFRHHILPANCGWWKKFETSRWNLVKVTQPLHLSLHSYLVHLFPYNQKLAFAVTITANKSNPDNKLILENKDLIIEYHKSGKSAGVIAKKFKVHENTIYRYFRKWGVSQGIKRINKTDKLDIIKRYKQGQFPEDIAKNVGVTGDTVRRWLKKWKLITRSRAEAHVSLVKTRCKDAIIKQYKKLKFQREIAEHFKISEGALNKWLKEWGVERRTRSEASQLRWDRCLKKS